MMRMLLNLLSTLVVVIFLRESQIEWVVTVLVTYTHIILLFAFAFTVSVTTMLSATATSLQIKRKKYPCYVQFIHILLMVSGICWTISKMTKYAHIYLDAWIITYIREIHARQTTKKCQCFLCCMTNSFRCHCYRIHKCTIQMTKILMFSLPNRKLFSIFNSAWRAYKYSLSCGCQNIVCSYDS